MDVLPQNKVILNLPFTGKIEVIRMNTSNSFKNWFDIKERIDDIFFLIENEDMTLKVDMDAIKEFVYLHPMIYFNQLIWDNIF